MSSIPARAFAVASATAVTAVGSVVGVASNSIAQPGDTRAAATDTTLLTDIPAGQQVEVQTAALTRQAEGQAVQADLSTKRNAERAAREAAAKTAIAKREAARKAAQEAETAAASPSVASLSAQGSYTVAQIQTIAQQMVPSGQWTCFSNIVNHESSWNYQAVNASSGAYGLFQALPGSKMSSVGADWRTNPATQIKWGLTYMNSSYGSPCQAWTFWQANHWY
ncbi:transglycosylase SLT domain-containing protein [Streptomyces sp. NPDC090106]|uniref:aggregation-promoting factor C-terminal-like domain-containing protein n=1 Tax=Streptomyces sp. NPDC090106 TaxID=3365946 RepID=UPI00381B2289